MCLQRQPKPLGVILAIHKTAVILRELHVMPHLVCYHVNNLPATIEGVLLTMVINNRLVGASLCRVKTARLTQHTRSGFSGSAAIQPLGQGTSW